VMAEASAGVDICWRRGWKEFVWVFG